jgi:mono/diheme cytochrome c family protein
MGENRASWALVIAGGMALGLLLVAFAGVLLWLGGPLRSVVRETGFESEAAANGAQIYFTGTSRRGTLITQQMGPGMGRMRGSRRTCASCHGPEGRGGDIRMMMRVIEVPDVRYDTLTSEEHGDHGEEGEEEHEPYTEETIKRAITEGVEPNGETLEWPMGRWSMSDEDLDDLVDFLKTLD